MEEILIIEDEEKIARFVELELGYEGYKVKKAPDGREGLALVKAHPFDMCSSRNKKGTLHSPGNSLTDKIRSSLVLKLNLRMPGLLLAGFMFINIVVSLLFFGVNPLESGNRS